MFGFFVIGVVSTIVLGVLFAKPRPELDRTPKYKPEVTPKSNSNRKVSDPFEFGVGFIGDGMAPSEKNSYGMGDD